MLYPVNSRFWRRHPALVAGSVALAVWLSLQGWYATLAVLTTAATLIAIRRTRRARSIERAGLRARAEFENRLTGYGDPRGVFGRYPPARAGWFTDPVSQWRLRYFDGWAWTGHTAVRPQTFGQ
ncbi:DUF2510 domain-containing protein [Mycolicibacterium sp. 624]|uniref:DUF2510 domain-containing protein n=1 Tax=Mycolicibacterium sp. 624 TaxID=3156314 RepID=UPI0033954178